MAWEPSAQVVVIFFDLRLAIPAKSTNDGTLAISCYQWRYQCREVVLPVLLV
jgi:hypothetical protein